ncbi:hypothetical protein [Alienimonas californiensis]|uniref:Uncharacterized protein n=1 Tax=Alienimonas californiensis TaxID=2527989 RepID=A0A517PCK5_9PLAN|nr:hypothetical protein [Alienimonas californiensis]QDT17100.1 hypothetical protein CA12_32120 [Alienimonas californiensis]
MAAAFGVRLATVVFVASVLRDAARGTDANAALVSALLAAAFGYLPGLVAGGACGRLATEVAQRELDADEASGGSQSPEKEIANTATRTAATRNAATRTAATRSKAAPAAA